jgi:tripartite-type tricarboxylate transporter receptor subunit TctC
MIRIVLLISMMCFVFPAHSTTLYVGANTGNSYTLYAKAFSESLSRNLKEPIRIVNDPGAGGLILYNKMRNPKLIPQDGSVIALIPSQMIFQQISAKALGDSQAIDPVQFNWLGSLASDVPVLVVNDTSDIRNWNDLQTKQVFLGATSANHDAAVVSKTLIKYLSLKNARSVEGFSSLNDIFLALQRNEVNALGLMTLDTLLNQKQNEFANKLLIPIIQYTEIRDPRIPEVPTVYEIGLDRMASFLFKPYAINRIILAPPNVSAARLKVLNDAFRDSVADTVYISDMQRLKLDNSPKLGAEVTSYIKDSNNISLEQAELYQP